MNQVQEQVCTRLACADRFIDPYLVWAVVSRFRSFRRHRDRWPDQLSFVIEREDGDGRPTRSLEIPPAYDTPMVNGKKPRYATARLKVNETRGVGVEADKVTRNVLRLLDLPGIARLVVGYPRPSWHRALVLPKSARSASDLAPSPAQHPQSKSRVVLGVIEDCCPFAHESLQHEQRTRVLALWDQSGYKSRARSPVGFRYGSAFTADQLNDLVRAHRGAPGLNEEQMYSGLPFSTPPLLSRASHAGAIFGLFAAEPLRPGRLGIIGDRPLERRDLDAESKGALDAMSQAPIVAVQLPREQLWVSAARWLPVSALDAMHFIVQQARELDAATGTEDGPGIVVNLSYGALAGPHDGTSMLESALIELCNATPGLHIVLAAGNSAGTFVGDQAGSPRQAGAVLPSGVHGEHELAPGVEREFTVLVPVDKPIETYLEVWFSEPDLGDRVDQHLRADEVMVEVTPPGDLPALRAAAGGCAHAYDEDGNVIASLLFPIRPCQSRHRSMALLVVAATRSHAKYTQAPAGLWTVCLRQSKRPDVRKLVAQAWVERDDFVDGRPAAQQASLVANRDGACGHLNDYNTLSSIATARHERIVVCGAVTTSLATGGYVPSRYSAAGDEECGGPRHWAVADEMPSLPGVRVNGNRSGGVVRVNGTSVAAPQVARWIARHLIKSRTDRSADHGPLGKIIHEP